MSNTAVDQVIERIVDLFPAGRPGRPSTQRRNVRVYLAREVYDRSPSQLMRQYALAPTAYKAAVEHGRKLVRSKVDEATLKEMILDVTMAPHW